MADASPLTGSPSLNAALGGPSGPGGAPPIDFNALISKQEEQTKAFQTKTEETEKSISEDVEKGHAATFDFVNAAKKAGDAFKQPPPVEKDRSPLEGFGSTAGILAAFGSLLTRQPLTNALNASAGVMNAYKAQDMAKFQQQMDAYKINIENAKTMYALQSDAYNAIINDNKTSIEAKRAALSAYAAAFKDETMQQLGTYREMVNHSQFMDKQNQQLQEYVGRLDLDLKRVQERQVADQGKITEGQIKMQLWQQVQADPGYAALTPDQKAAKYHEVFGTGSGANAAPIADETADRVADQYIAGDRQAISGFARNAASVTKLQDAITRRMKAQNISAADQAARMAEFTGIVAAERATGTREAQAGMAATEARSFIDLSRKAYEKLPRGQYLPFNKLTQAYETQTSSPEQAAAYTADFSLINAYVRAVSPTGVPPESLREHAIQMLNTAQSQEVHDSVLNQMQREMDQAVSSPEKVREMLRQTITRTGGGIAVGAGGGTGPKAPPAVGTIEDGHKFKGGDPSKPENWEKQ